MRNLFPSVSGYPVNRDIESILAGIPNSASTGFGAKLECLRNTTTAPKTRSASSAGSRGRTSAPRLIPPTSRDLEAWLFGSGDEDTDSIVGQEARLFVKGFSKWRLIFGEEHVAEHPAEPPESCMTAECPATPPESGAVHVPQ